MDDFDVKNHDQEIDDLLSEVKGLLGEEPEEDECPDESDAPDTPQEPSAPMTADDVNIDFEKFYDDAAGFPDEGIYTPPTAYEQSKSAYQVARRAEYDRGRARGKGPPAHRARPGGGTRDAKTREPRPQDGRKGQESAKIRRGIRQVAL